MWRGFYGDGTLQPPQCSFRGGQRPLPLHCDLQALTNQHRPSHIFGFSGLSILVVDSSTLLRLSLVYLIILPLLDFGPFLTRIRNNLMKKSTKKHLKLIERGDGLAVGKGWSIEKDSWTDEQCYHHYALNEKYAKNMLAMCSSSFCFFSASYLMPSLHRCICISKLSLCALLLFFPTTTNVLSAMSSLTSATRSPRGWNDLRARGWRTRLLHLYIRPLYAIPFYTFSHTVHMRTTFHCTRYSHFHVIIKPHLRLPDHPHCTITKSYLVYTLLV